MTLATTANRKTYVGNGVTKSFAFPYSVLTADDLFAYVGGALKAITTHYTLSGSAPYTAGTNVVFVTAPPSGAPVVLVRDPAMTQQVDLVEGDPLPVESAVEQPFDRLTMIVQRLHERQARSVRQPDTDTTELSELPVAATRASTVQGYDETGQLTLYPLDTQITTGGVGYLLDDIPENLHASIAAGTIASTVDLKEYLDVAFARAGRIIYAPRGKYPTSNLAKPACAGIVGDGDNETKFVATAAATKVLPLGSACKVLRHFRIEGNDVPDAIGLHMGDVVEDAGAFDIRCVRIKNFTGGTIADDNPGIGMKVDFALKSLIEFVTLENNTRDLLVEGDNAFPTTIDFPSLTCASCTGEAILIKGGDKLSFPALKIDSSIGASFTVRPPAAWSVTNLSVSPRLENDTAGGITYDMVFDAGAAASVIDAEVISPSFAYSARKAMHVTGTLAYVYLTKPRMPLVASMIVVDSGGTLDCPKWPSNLLAASYMVEDNVKGTFPFKGFNCPDANFTAWVPAIYSNVGNQATTFADLSLTNARFKLHGQKLGQFQVEWVGTLNAIAPIEIRIALPTGMAALNDHSWGSCHTLNTNWESGVVRGHSGGYLQQGRTSTTGAYVSGALVGGLIDKFVELA